MDENNSIQLFEDRKIRTAWDEEQEEWYFSVQDVVAVLSESADPKQYIKKMRARDPQLSANWGTICTPVQMLAADGKQRKVQAANTEGILRIIQSIPSPKAEPFKRWLAQVGRERIEEAIDPERAIEADTGRPAVTAENAAQLNAVVTDVIQGVAEADKPNGDEK